MLGDGRAGKRGLSIPLLLSLAALCGCEPERGIEAKKDVSPFNFAKLGCVDAEFRKAFDTMERWDYVSDGGSYPDGAQVFQFAYYRSQDHEGTATLQVGLVDNKMRIIHSFTGMGSELPQESFPPAIKAMRKAEHVLKAACGLDLAGMDLEAVGQRVGALN